VKKKEPQNFVEFSRIEETIFIKCIGIYGFDFICIAMHFTARTTLECQEFFIHNNKRIDFHRYTPRDVKNYEFLTAKTMAMTGLSLK
jgi:hypothetical protein